MATFEPFVLTATDGTPLGARWMRSPSPARAIALVAGATAVPQGYYRAWAADLADRGYDVLTLDYRGIAESRMDALRGYHATMRDWAERDLQAALDLALAEAGARPVLWVGHSFGGQALGLVRGGERLAGGVTIGAQLGWYGHWPLQSRWLYAGLWYAGVPALTALYGYLPGRLGIGEDLPMGVAREWATWCRSRNYLLDHVPEARDRFASASAPFRVFAISDDPYAPEPAVAAYAELLPGAQLRRWTPADAGVSKIGHFGFFRPPCRRLWEQAAAFLDERVAASARPEPLAATGATGR